MSTEKADGRWDALYEKLRLNSPALYSVVSKSIPLIRDERKTIVFVVRSGFYKRKLDDHPYKTRLSEVVKEEYGNEWKAVSMYLAPKDRAEQKLGEASVETPVQTNSGIYIENVKVSNFRSLKNISVDLQPDINILLGANNVGKSAIIDAVRLALQVGTYKRTLHVNVNDFNDQEKEVEIDLRFHCPEDITGLPDFRVFDKETNQTYLEIHVRYSIYLYGNEKRVKQRFWGGRNEHRTPEEDVMSIFGFEYLSALRDASLMLKPSKNSKIAELLLNIRPSSTERDAIETVFRDAQEHSEVKKLTAEATTSVQTHLEKISLRHDLFDINLNSLPLTYEELVGGFDMLLTKGGMDQRVSQNGLGYNNVLYASTVLGHLKKRKSVTAEKYHALLIEEPEAHLHPQLEDSLFSYISQLGTEIGSQIIVTTHSSIITSTSPIKNLSIISADKDSNISALSVASIQLLPSDERKIQRYLDVTKARLFFARGVMFVEGITETLLTPHLADIYFGETNSLTKRGIEVVNIDGVSFEPYAKLFTSETHRLPMRAVILTDRDSDADSISKRSQNVLNMKSNDLDVQVSEGRTLEIDLWNSGNDELMIEAGKNVLATKANIESAEVLLSKLSNNKDVGKGDLAQELIDLSYTKKIELKVPKYFENGFKWVE